MSRFRTVAALVFTGLLIPAGLATGQAAQTIPAPAAAPEKATPTTVLHANANLVLVDVVVTDHGKAVHGLDRGRFHILENGKEQPISAFDEHRPPAASADTAELKAKIAQLPANTYTNIPVYPDAGVVNVLLLDGLNTPMVNQVEARRQMVQYLSTITPGTSLALFTLSSQLRLVEGFTTDAARLATVLKSKAAASSQSALLDTAGHSAQQDVENQLSAMAGSSQPPSPETVAALTQFETDLTATQTDLRVRLTMDALQQLARYLSAIPGRKNLIWFSGSFPISLDPDPDQALPFLAVRTYEDDVRKTSELLTAARVAVYPVDARGMMTQSTADAAYSPNRTALSVNSGGKVSAMNDSNVIHDYDTFMTQNMQEHGSMQQIAQETGGTASMNTNDLKGAVASAVENGASYYSIAFAPGGKKLDGRFRKIQVRLDNGGYNLAYRRGYFADASNKPSAHNPGTSSTIQSAALHGAPPATQVLFLARVLPATDPAFQGIPIPNIPSGEMAASLKGPTRCYLVDLTVDPHGLVFNSESDGARQAQVEFVLEAYDSDGKRENYVDRSYAINIKPEDFAQKMETGVRARLALDLPEGHSFMRVAVEDLIAGHAGSLEVPVTVIAN
ncbi:MAG TPA: VWA domain-containing protein [Terracidiphilus sp.]|nr:VWA domain-containing protein [Terracidiphilus sp.]